MKGTELMHFAKGWERWKLLELLPLLRILGGLVASQHRRKVEWCILKTRSH